MTLPSVIERHGKNFYTDKKAMRQVVQSNCLAESKLPTIRYLTAQEPKELIRRILKALEVVFTYYPDDEAYYTSLPFVQTFIGALKSKHPNITPEDIDYALWHGMIDYKYHTSPKLNDLIHMVNHYIQTERTQWIEDAHHDNKFRMNEIHPNVIEVIKKATDEGLKELEQEKEEQRQAKKAYWAKLKAEAAKKANKMK